MLPIANAWQLHVCVPSLFFHELSKCRSNAVTVAAPGFGIPSTAEFASVGDLGNWEERIGGRDGAPQTRRVRSAESSHRWIVGGRTAGQPDGPCSGLLLGVVVVDR
jgi:hypothetical protein